MKISELGLKLLKEDTEDSQKNRWHSNRERSADKAGRLFFSAQERLMNAPAIPYPHPAIQHTRCLLALTVNTCPNDTARQTPWLSLRQDGMVIHEAVGEAA